MYAIILAAGYATRLYPLTLNQPKALLTIGRQTILDHIVDEIETITDVTRIVVVSNAKFYTHFTRWAAGRNACGRNDCEHNASESNDCEHNASESNDCEHNACGRVVVLNDGTTDEHSRLGAIGDIAFAIRELSIDEDILVIAGDNFFTYRLADVCDFFRRNGADTVVVKRFEDRNDLKSMGVAILDASGNVAAFEEKPQNPASDLGVFATYLYRRETLPLFGAYLDAGNPKDAPGNFPAWLCKRRRVAAFAFDGECYDVGTPEAYNMLREQYADY